IEIGPDIFCTLNLISISFPKGNRRANLYDFSNHTFCCKWEARAVFGCFDLDVIVKRSKPQDAPGTFVEWIEVGFIKRPTAVWNPVPFFKINLVKRQTPGPHTQGAAKIAKTGTLEWQIGKSNISTIRK